MYVVEHRIGRKRALTGPFTDYSSAEAQTQALHDVTIRKVEPAIGALSAEMQLIVDALTDEYSADDLYAIATALLRR